jgi:hypothetical protein
MTRISVCRDLNQAKRLWRALSPRRTIFDEWEWRYCFYKHNPRPLLFLAAWEGEEAVGLLPLQQHPDHGYEFFAEDPCEENRPFIKPSYEKIIPELYAAIPGPAVCYDISGDDEFTMKLPLEDYKYILPLSGLKDFNDFLNSRLAVKRRRSLIKEISDLEKNKISARMYRPDIADATGGRPVPPVGPAALPLSQAESDLELLFSLNHGNFRGESYLKEEELAPWRDLLQLPFDWRISVAAVDGVRIGVSLSVLYNKQWQYLITGVDFKNWPGLGKHLVKANIEAAIAAGADIFDAGLGDCGWKHIWHFDKIPQYEFIKEA